MWLQTRQKPNQSLLFSEHKDISPRYDTEYAVNMAARIHNWVSSSSLSFSQSLGHREFTVKLPEE